MALNVLAYNMKRVMNIMGIRPLLAAMRVLSSICRRASDDCTAAQRDDAVPARPR